MKRALQIGGFLGVLLGLIWIGQGTGALPYPAASFMINQTPWAWYGAVLAALGIAAIVMSQRLR